MKDPYIYRTEAAVRGILLFYSKGPRRKGRDQEGKNVKESIKDLGSLEDGWQTPTAYL